MYDIVELNSKLVADLREIAKNLNIPKTDKLLKKDLIYKILDQQALNPTTETLAKESAKPSNKPQRGPKRKQHEKVESKDKAKTVAASEPKQEQAKRRRGRPKRTPIATSDVSSTPTQKLSVLEDESISSRAPKGETKTESGSGTTENKPERRGQREQTRSRMNGILSVSQEIHVRSGSKENHASGETRGNRYVSIETTGIRGTVANQERVEPIGICRDVKTLIRNNAQEKNLLLNLREWSLLKVFLK